MTNPTTANAIAGSDADADADADANVQINADVDLNANERSSTLLDAHFPQRPDKPLILKASQTRAIPNQAATIAQLMPELAGVLGRPRPPGKKADLVAASRSLARRLMKSLRSLGNGEPFKAQVRHVARQLLNAVQQLDPGLLIGAYRTFGELLAGQTSGGATVRGSVLGLVEPQKLGPAARAQLYGDVRIDRQDALFLTGLQFANEELAQRPSLATSWQDLFMARLTEDLLRSALLKQPIITDPAALERLRTSALPEAQSLVSAVKTIYPQWRAMAEDGHAPAPQFLVDIPESASSNSPKSPVSTSEDTFATLGTDATAFEAALNTGAGNTPLLPALTQDTIAAPVQRPGSPNWDLALPPASTDPVPLDRLHVIVQSKQEPGMETATQRLFDSDSDHAVWLDKVGSELRMRRNGQLIDRVGPQTAVELHVVGPIWEDVTSTQIPYRDTWPFVENVTRSLQQLGFDQPMAGITVYDDASSPTDLDSPIAGLNSFGKLLGLLTPDGGVLAASLSSRLPAPLTLPLSLKLPTFARHWTAYPMREFRSYARSHQGLLQVVADNFAGPPSAPSPLDVQAKQVMSDAVAKSLQTTLRGVGVMTVPQDGLTAFANEIATGLVEQRWQSFSDAYQRLRNLIEYRPDKLLMAMQSWETGLMPVGDDQLARPPRLPPTTLSFLEGAYVVALDAGLAAFTQWHGRIGDQHPNASIDPARVGLLHAALVSIFFEQPFVIDGHRLLHLADSTNAADKALYGSTRRLYAGLQAAAQGGLLPSPVVSIPEGVQDQDDVRARVDQALIPAQDDEGSTLAPQRHLDDSRPLEGVARAAPEIRQTLDRAAGTITLEWDQAGFATPRKTRFKFQPLANVADTSALAAQDQAIRWLDKFSVSYFLRDHRLSTNRLPPEVVLESDSLRVGELTLAQRIHGQWRADPARLRELVNVYTLPEQMGALALERWPGEQPTPAATLEPPKRVRVFVRLSPDLDAGRQLYANHPNETVVIDADRFGQQKIVAGAHLLQHFDGLSDIKWVVLGHGGYVGSDFSTVMADYSPEALAERLQRVARELQLPGPIRRLSLIGCKLETRALPNRFTESFIKHGVSTGAFSADVQVTASTQTLILFESGGKRRRAPLVHFGAAVQYHQPGLQYRFERNALTGEITKTDKYPLGSEKGLMFKRNPDTGAITAKNPALSSATPVDREISQTWQDIEARALMARDFGLTAAAQMAPHDAWQALGRSGILTDTGAANNKSDPSTTGSPFRASEKVGTPTANPIDLDPKRLIQTLEAGDEDRVALGGQLLALPDEQFNAFTHAATTALRTTDLPADHVQALRSWIDHTSVVRQRMSAVPKPSGSSLGSTLESGGNLALGVLGVYQVAAGWKSMDATQRGLALTQASGFVISPLASAAGRLIASLAAGARFLSVAGELLQGGIIDLPLAAVSLALIGEQWKAFNASGQGTDSFAYRSLVANTVITVVTTAVSLGMAGAQITAMLASATIAEAFAGLAAAAGEVALPFALLVLAVSGIVSTVLWADEYLDHLRGSDWDIIGAGAAKFFGLDTDATRRAEVDTQAEKVAAQRLKSIEEQAQRHHQFLSDFYAKMGFQMVKTTAHDYGVRYATFKKDDLSALPKFIKSTLPLLKAATEAPKTEGMFVAMVKTLASAQATADGSKAASPDENDDLAYTFVLQDVSKPRALLTLDAGTSLLPKGAHAGTAWVEVDDRLLHHSGDGEAPSQPQLFDLSGNRALGIRGGLGNDLFVLNASSHIHILDGAGGQDQVQLNAQQVGVRYEVMPDNGSNQGASFLSYAPLEGHDPGSDLRFKGSPMVTVMGTIRQLRVLDAGAARILGGPADEYFDISGQDVLVEGRGGRNTFQVRAGNRIVTSSNDLLLWDASASAVVVDQGDARSPLLLQVSVPYEDLKIAREGEDLLVSGRSGQPLRFEGYYRPGSDAEADSDAKPAGPRPLLIRDVSGLLLSPTPQHPLTSKPVPLTSISGTIQYDATIRMARRYLPAGHGQTLHRLPRGSGTFHARPNAALPPHVDLDLPASDLQFDFDGDDLVVSERAAGDAARLVLVLRGYRRQRVGQPGVVLLARRGKDASAADVTSKGLALPDATPILLRLPAPDAAVAGPVQWHDAGTSAPATQPLPPARDPEKRPTATPAKGQAADRTPDPTPDPARTGTPGPDRLDTEGLPPNTLLAGGDGHDHYHVRPGHRVRINNASLDQRLDTLAIAARADDIVMQVQGEDLLISTADRTGTAARVIGYQADASLRHLRLHVHGGGRYLLPVADPLTGALVHDLSRSWDDVLIASPGLHVMRVPKPHQMMVKGSGAERPKRHVYLQAPLREHDIHKDGLDAQLSFGFGEFRTVIRLIDFYADPYALRFQWHDPDSGALQTSEGLLLPPALAQEAADAGVKNPTLTWLEAHAVSDDPQLRQAFWARFEAPIDLRPIEPDLVTLYLRAKGLPEDDTTPWPALTAAQVRRLLRLREVAGVEVPRELLLSYARSNYGPTTLTAYQHRALIQHLLKADHGAPFFTVALYSDLTLPQMRAFERWAAQTRPGESLSEWAPLALSKFSRWMVSKPGRRERLEPEDASLMVAFLEYQGRAPEDASELAAVMVEARTADVAYVEAMRDLGITRGARIGQLKRAGVQPREVLMANVAGGDYHGLKDRSAKVTVTTSDVLQNRSTFSQNRYWLEQYLVLDEDGDNFIALGSSRAEGTEFDLAPGPLVDRAGGSPDLYFKQDDLGQPLPEATGTMRPHGLAQLVRRQLVKFAEGPAITELRWFGRSTPGNLVDGSLAGGEARAWLPWLAPQHDGGWQPLEVQPDKLAAVQFTMADPVLLTQLDLRVQLQAPATASVRQEGLSWRVDASVHGAKWTEVGLARWAPVNLPASTQPLQLVHRIPLATEGVPYRHYRLVATSGQFRPDEWINEVVFHTAPVTDEVPASVNAARKPHGAESPTLEAVTVEPVTFEPVTSEPVTSEPATLKPSTLEPVTQVGSMSTAHLSLQQAMAGFDTSNAGAALGFQPQRPHATNAQSLLAAAIP